MYFLKKLYPKHSLYFGIKPDLTYYHNSSLPLKIFLYFPEKDPGALLDPKLKENKKMYPQEISYIFCL